MRLWQLLVAALLVGVCGAGPVWADAVEVYDEGHSVELGDDIRGLIRVRNDDEVGTTLVNGDVVIWAIRSLTNTSLDNRWSVSTTTIAADPRVAGVFTGDVNENSVAVGRYGYLQTHGIHSAVRTTGPIEPESTVLETSTTRGRAQGTGSASRGQVARPMDRVGSGTGTAHAVVTVE